MSESIALAFNDLALGGSSDKVYHIALNQFTTGNWTVTIQYGRRGSALMSQVKIMDTDYERAKKLFDKIKREKMSKGYIEQGTSPAPQKAPDGALVADIKPPELLEEIVNGQGPRPFIESDDYWMQDKSDGVSRGVIKQNDQIFGINKKAEVVPLPAELVAELELIDLRAFQLDAELVGNKLVCRDLLVANTDISFLSYAARHDRLEALIKSQPFTLISLVATWTKRKSKEAALEQQRIDRKEGVVFKLISAAYRPGRSGQHKKFKFIKSLSAIAGKPRAKGKESIEVFLLNEEFKCVRCGTVSLIGKPKVEEGDIVEVTYLYAMPSGLMQQARLSYCRTDVAYEDCTTAQLIYKREEAE